MRRIVLTCSLLSSLSLAGCSLNSGHEASDGPAAETQDAIAFGTPDSAHTAVLAIVGNSTQGQFVCSGSIVQVKNGQAYVLTAAHCCNDGAPAMVIQGANYQTSSNVTNVTAGSIYWDPLYTTSQGFDHDFCMFKFPTSAALPTLKLPASCATDGVATGVDVEHVGYGMTDTNPNNSARNTGTDKISSFDNTTIDYKQGGTAKIPGPCEGDSGGPALLPAGAAQSSQTIVGVTSFGMTTNCGAFDTGTSSRVCSEIGTNKFITNFLNDTPSGNQPGTTTTGNCQTCSQNAQSGACASAAQACANDAKCAQLNTCLGGCTTQTCVDNCVAAAGQTAANEYNNFVNCICNTACPTECAAECPSSGACGFGAQDPTCDACLTGKCCAQDQACFNNSTCSSCIQATNPPASCNSNAQYTSLVTCLQNNCNAECLGGTTSSSSSSSGNTSTSSSSSSGNTTTSSSSSGNTTTSSSGTVTTSSGNVGNGGAGGADGNTGGGDVGMKSGCSVNRETGSGSSEGAGIAGLLFALAISAVRRRKSA